MKTIGTYVFLEVKKKHCYFQYKLYKSTIKCLPALKNTKHAPFP